jgi:flagellar biosynthesis chaperone FliJ
VAVYHALRRLLEVRGLEEEQHRLALESALGEVHRLEIALRTARSRERAGRQRIALSAHSGEAADRIAGIVDLETGRRGAVLLARRLADAEARAAELRAEYLAKRVERRQVETVIQEAKALESLQGGRRDQQRLDDWFAARRHGRLRESDLHSGDKARGRQHSDKHEMKKDQESPSIPEEESSSNL